METEVPSRELHAFTDDVVRSVKARAKSMKHRGINISIDRVKEVQDGAESDTRRLNVDIGYRVEALPVQLRLAIWDDRWIWLDARRGGKAGWTWHTTLEGRFVSREGAKGLVRQIEATVDASFELEPSRLIAKIWKAALTLGPRPT
jgi:hypothetical protein